MTQAAGSDREGLQKTCSGMFSVFGLRPQIARLAPRAHQRLSALMSNKGPFTDLRSANKKKAPQGGLFFIGGQRVLQRFKSLSCIKYLASPCSCTYTSTHTYALVTSDHR